MIKESPSIIDAEAWMVILSIRTMMRIPSFGFPFRESYPRHLQDRCASFRDFERCWHFSLRGERFSKVHGGTDQPAVAAMAHLSGKDIRDLAGDGFPKHERGMLGLRK